jgi:putative NADH-flavin reductase
MEHINTIAVIGGTGKAGTYLVKQLIEQGYHIKLLMRDPAKLETNSPLIQKIIGDIRDENTVYRLVEGCNAVISTLGQRKDELPVFSLAACNIIQAMNKFGIKRYIVITGLTLDTPEDNKGFRTRLLSRIMKFSFPAIIADKQQEYLLLALTQLDWTVVRLPMIEQSTSLGNLKINLTDCPGKKISAADLAVFLIQQLSDTSFIRKAPFIANG